MKGLEKVYVNTTTHNTSHTSLSMRLACETHKEHHIRHTISAWNYNGENNLKILTILIQNLLLHTPQRGFLELIKLSRVTFYSDFEVGLNSTFLSWELTSLVYATLYFLINFFKGFFELASILVSSESKH